jgi:hypothetical protein
MSIQIDSKCRIILDGWQTLFNVAQSHDGTRVWSTTGHPVKMPHSRYSLTSSYGLNPGVAGLDQFEMDVRRIVAAAHTEYLEYVGRKEVVAAARTNSLEALTKAQDAATLATRDLQDALKTANAVAAMVLLPMIADSAKLANQISGLIHAMTEQ